MREVKNALPESPVDLLGRMASKFDPQKAEIAWLSVTGPDSPIKGQFNACAYGSLMCYFLRRALGEVSRGKGLDLSKFEETLRAQRGAGFAMLKEDIEAGLDLQSPKEVLENAIEAVEKAVSGLTEDMDTPRL